MVDKLIQQEKLNHCHGPTLNKDDDDSNIERLTTRDTRATTTNKNAKNNVKAGKNAIKVLNNNSIQITKRKVKKRFTDGHLSSFTQFGHDVKRKMAKNRSYWKTRNVNCVRKKRSVTN